MRVSHVAWNVGGLAFPLVVAVLTVPGLIVNLGQERFGLLALAWGLIGYAGAMDLGVGRALTQMVSRLLGENSMSTIPNVLSTAGRITLAAGLVGALLIAFVAMSGGHNLIATDNTPQGEIQLSMLLLALALPAQAMSATYRGMNEAFMNFKGINLVRAGLGVINFAGPYWISLFSSYLPFLVLTLVVSRLLALVIFRYLAIGCMKDLRDLPIRPSYSSEIARSLFSFGGWVTVSSVLSPIMMQADRFLIAFLISASAVTAYVVPYEVVVKSLFLVGAISSVMFPALGKMMRDQSSDWRPYFKKWVIRVAALMLLVCVGLASVFPTILPLWIKHSHHPDSIVIGQILCLGVFANSIGSMFYAAIHAKGRADLTAKLHLIELPIYGLSLVLLLDNFGLFGAAWAWVGRMVFDTSALAIIFRFEHA